ncbi:type I polyketide synthase [Streptomyces niveiscabiei]|uniref:type I polyketide synthase n=2 Tax=Streptomyces niveiscabiei TaxID=164115 RepID=UPI003EBC4C30
MSTAEPIAIVGIGCRFPGAAGPAEFWELLAAGTDAVTPVPPDRFDVSAWYDPSPGTPDSLISRHGGFLTGLFDFDDAFFGISPREARTMDPQQRLLLHTVWEAFEDASIPPSTVRGSHTGVFVGQSTAEYAETTGRAATADVRALAGGRLRAVTAGRLSHAFDLRGPSLVLDTACSSSLVAVHTARQSLLSGECDLAVAAGVNAVLSPLDAVAYSQGRMLAPDGRCKFGDSRADGFVRGEGVGAVLLKRLSRALADGDPVRAVLLGSAVTNDGDGSGLLLQPAVPGQAAMLRAAWRSAGVAPGEVDYVEAHGTGTTVGDGVELRALAEVLREGGELRERGELRGTGESAPSVPAEPTPPPAGLAPCPSDPAPSPAGPAPLLVGSVKTNIGHAEAAAGIAGLIKAVLMVERRTVPASLHHASPHPCLAEPGFPVAVADRAAPLRPRGERAVLGVSSFGLSGTNAHVVVGEFTAEAAGPEPSAIPELSAVPEPTAVPEPSATDDVPGPHILVLSARTDRALRQLALRYAAHLEPGGHGRGHRLRDICRSAATGRDAHPLRLWAVGDTHDDLAGVLRALAAGEPTPDGALHEAGFTGPRDVVFVFPGQGSQWTGMGRDLLRTSDAFRTAMRECDAAVREELGWSVIELLEKGPEPDSVSVVQPVLWAMEVALAAHWRALGVDPDLCVGHSMGEAAAACVAGALSVRDAARVICRRSALMRRHAGRGAMLAVELSPRAAHALVEQYGDGVCVAAENSPAATVLAGEPAVLDEIAAELDRRGVLCRPVDVDVASHSPLMDRAARELPARLADLEPGVPRTDLFSTLRCAPVTGGDLDGRYWADNLRQPVRFAESVRRIAEDRDAVFVEVSPHPLLGQALADIQQAAGRPPAVVSTLVRRRSEPAQALRALGRAYGLGARVDWRRWFGPGTPVPLPLYAWDARHHRADPEAAAPRPTAPRPAERRLRLSRLTGSPDTAVTVRGVARTAVVAYLQAVAETLRDLAGEGTAELRDVRLGDRLPTRAQADGTTLAVRVRETPDDGYGFRVEARHDSPDAYGGPALCVSGTARIVPAPSGVPSRGELDGALTRCGEYVPAAEFYRAAEARGYHVGPGLRAVRQLWRREGEAVARLDLPGGAGADALEAALLVMLGAWPHAGDADCAYRPVSFERVVLAGVERGEVWSLARFTPERGGDRARCDVVLIGADGRVFAGFQGIGLLRVPEGGSAAVTRVPAARGSGSVADRLYLHAATVLGTTVDRVDPRRSLRDLGLDSLMALQLRRVLRQDLGVELPASRLLGDESAGTLAAGLADVRV